MNHVVRLDEVDLYPARLSTECTRRARVKREGR